MKNRPPSQWSEQIKGGVALAAGYIAGRPEFDAHAADTNEPIENLPGLLDFFQDTGAHVTFGVCLGLGMVALAKKMNFLRGKVGAASAFGIGAGLNVLVIEAWAGGGFVEDWRLDTIAAGVAALATKWWVESGPDIPKLPVIE